MSQLSERDPAQARLQDRCRELAAETSLLFAELMQQRRDAPLDREWWDHDIDLYYQWRATRISFWLERGIFNSLALPGDGDTLELACGDGFNARQFYSLRSRRVVACDKDPLAVEHAQAYNAAENVEYRVADVATAMPEGTFDNIIFDAAIEHLTADEIGAVLQGVKARLSARGIFSGYTLIDNYPFPYHDTAFKLKQDLYDLLQPPFRCVTVFETIYPTRHNLYWWASDGTALPFAEGWAHVCR